MLPFKGILLAKCFPGKNALAYLSRSSATIFLQDRHRCFNSCDIIGCHLHQSRALIRTRHCRQRSRRFCLIYKRQSCVYCQVAVPYCYNADLKRPGNVRSKVTLARSMIVVDFEKWKFMILLHKFGRWFFGRAKDFSCWYIPIVSSCFLLSLLFLLTRGESWFETFYGRN